MKRGEAFFISKFDLEDGPPYWASEKDLLSDGCYDHNETIFKCEIVGEFKMIYPEEPLPKLEAVTTKAKKTVKKSTTKKSSK